MEGDSLPRVQGTLIAYRTAGANSTATSRIAQKLYGQDTKSRGYKVRRRGLLDSVPHVRLIRGVIVIRPTDEAAVKKLLTGLGCEIQVRTVNLTPTDVATLTG